MKVEVECAPCVLQRGYLEIEKATSDPSLQLRAMSALVHLLTKEFKPTAVAAHLGTERDRIVKEVTGNPDPYARAKQISNQRALEILPKARNMVLSGSSAECRFRRACLC
ncbi:MAG: ARMT1-like domain-containing protein, partial [Candidatus Bathyarchaeia archaeon]